MSAKSRLEWQKNNRLAYNAKMRAWRAKHRRRYNAQMRRAAYRRRRQAEIQLALDSLWSAHRLRTIGVRLI